ncbi:MAG: universal stress protein [Halobacteriales archaeon]
MDRALAVVEADEATKDLVREAGELAGGVGAELVLVHVTGEDEYEERRSDLESITELDVSYGIEKAKDGAAQFASDIGREVLSDVDVEWDAIGRVGMKGDTVLSTAESLDCDHVFIAGEKRSPAGKAVFGDVTQEVILEFDGAVTVVTV